MFSVLLRRISPCRVSPRVGVALLLYLIVSQGDMAAQESGVPRGSGANKHFRPVTRTSCRTS